MAYLKIDRFAGKKNHSVHASDLQQQQAAQQEGTYGRGNATRRHGFNQPQQEPDVLSKEQQGIIDLERMVAEGRQSDIDVYFDNWVTVPNHLGDWELRTNVKRQDNVTVGRTIVPLPLTVRTRAIFRQGRLVTLMEAGFTEDDARRYYKAAWKRKFVWIPTVISAVKEMIDSFQTTDPLKSYHQALDPRRLAHLMQIPRNPYQTAHNHFIVAVEMGMAIITSRLSNDDADDQSSMTFEAPPDSVSSGPEEATESDMVPL